MTPPPATPHLQLDAVSVSLDAAAVLSSITLSIPRGAWVGVVGPNGAGKTTLLRAITRLLPFEGEIRLDGRRLADHAPQALAREMAFVRQRPEASFDLSVRDVVLLGRAPHAGWLVPYGPEDRARAEAVLADLDLTRLADRSILALSGGEYQRVLLAQALAQDAPLLLLDEPTSHLDVRHQYRLLDTLQGLVKRGRTVVSVFHDLDQVARYTDAVAVLDAGRLADYGSPAAVLTPALLADVFGMRARCREIDGHLHIDYIAPIES